MLQFETAVLVAPLTYEISGLLRGQAGTERAMRSPVAAEAPFVLLDGALARIDLTQDEIGLPYSWRYGPASRSVGDATFGERTHAFQGSA